MDRSSDSQAAQDFRDGTSGAFSDIASRGRVVPPLRFDNDEPGGDNFVKFDGIEASAVRGHVATLIDASTSFPPAGELEMDELSRRIRRIQRALRTNKKYDVVFEFANREAAEAAAAFFSAMRLPRVRVRVRGGPPLPSTPWTFWKRLW